MEPESSLSPSQEPATSIYPEPQTYSPHFLPYFPKVHSNILPSMTRSTADLFPSGFPIKVLHAFLISSMRAICPKSNPPWFDHPNNIWWSVQSCEALHYAVFSSLPPFPPS